MSELTKDQAAARAGVSTKAIERWVRAGKLDQRFRPQAGTSPVAVYLVEDVDRIIAGRRTGPPTPFLVPDGPTPSSNGNGHGSTELPIAALSLQTLTAASGPDLLRMLVGALAQVWTSQTLSQTPKPFLTVEEAAAYSGETARDLRRAIRTGELPARHKERRDWRTWRIKRTDLEAL
jgi:excisionase family DNA binding protein